MNRHIIALVGFAVISASAYGATTFAGRLRLIPEWVHQKTTGVSANKETFSDFIDWTHTSGTNANQMATIISQAGTLTNSQSAIIDLTACTNGFGDAVSFASVRFLTVTASSANTDPIQIGDAGANAFAAWAGSTNSTINVTPGGAFVLLAPNATGYAVSTNGLLKIANIGTNSASYVLYVGGSE